VSGDKDTKKLSILKITKLKTSREIYNLHIDAFIEKIMTKTLGLSFA
jgi:hypothetical protein